MGMDYLTFVVLLLFSGSTCASVFYKPTPVFATVSNTLHEDHCGKSYKSILDSLKIRKNELNEAINFASNSLQKMERFEMNLRSANIEAKQGSPTKGIYIVNSPNNVSIARGKDALIVSHATNYLINSHNHKHKMTQREWGQTLSSLNYKGSKLSGVCETVNKVCTQMQINSPYRFADGSCNNAIHGARGESNTVYKRLLYPDYLDGISEFRNSVTKKNLPSARSVSTVAFDGDSDADGDLTTAVGQWWQFIEQDLSQTAASMAVFTGNEIECCDEGFRLSPRYQHKFCAPIIISDDDPYYSKHYMSCMPYIRSLPGIRHECNFGPRDQVNQATHFLDGSQIYGSTLHEQDSLRSFKNGQLKTSTYKGNEYLPLSSNPTIDCQVNSQNAKCFRSGDSRVNLHPYMTTLHILWNREHNRIAEGLSRLNRNWDDEKIFQESRRIVIAELQHITYNEYLPILLGKKIHNSIMLADGYDPNVDPRISNSFATAALRSLNSLMDDTIKLYNENRKSDSFMDLEKYFNKPDVILQQENLDKLIRSLSTQAAQKQDKNYAGDMTSKLYWNGVYGLDVLSLDIQRGRDHGLRSYVHYRKLCGLNDVKRFEDFQDVMSHEAIDSLKKIYAHPDDVDLIVGGLLEVRLEDGLVGKTFSCIISNQLSRTKLGDRYFYRNPEQPRPFSKHQLGEIEKVSMASILCQNSNGILKMQPHAFKRINEVNMLTSCKDLPKLDLYYWKE